MQTSMNETQIKALFKSALVEVMEERRDIIHDAVEDVVEEIALSRAIQDGLRSHAVSREEIFGLFEKTA